MGKFEKEVQGVSTNDANKENIRAHEKETATLFSGEYMQSALEDSLGEIDTLDEARAYLDEILSSVEESGIFDDRIVNLRKDVVSQLEELKISSVKELIERASILVSDFISAKFSLGELEAIQRDNILEFESHLPINDLVYVEVKDLELSINIHNAKSMESSKKMRLFRQSLVAIAEKLKNDPDFANVENITMKSWIIEEHPKLAERYGFDLVGIDKGIIKRDKFIDRYSK